MIRGRALRWAGLILGLPLAGAFAHAEPAPCPANASAVGTARVLRVNATTPARLGRKQFPQTLPLAAGEVVLTFNALSPAAELALAVGRIEANHGGIVLLHDSKARTAAMLPELLRALKARGYRLVHVTADGTR
jgi:peptidoglycan/xylan/chitin deacetylase (PgdA/CDA1 family)